MIVVSGNKGERRQVVIGLSHANLDYLLEGNTLKITPEVLEAIGPDLEVYIVSRETDQEMHFRMIDQGVIAPGAKTEIKF